MVSPINLSLRRNFSVMFPARRSTKLTSPKDACAFFHLFLFQDLQNLQQSLAGDTSVSLRWCTEAMNLLKRMQIQLISLFKQCKLPETSSIFHGSYIDEGSNSSWFDHYMQETAALLDFCNSLKSAVSGINRYRMVIDFTVQKLAEGELMIDLIENDDKVLGSSREMVVRIDGCYSRKSRNIDAVMVAARCTMMVISVLLISAIVTPVSFDVRTEEVVGKFPQLKPFAETLTALVTQFHGKFLKPRNGSKFLLAEHEMVESVLAEKELDRELLRASSEELREGIEMFAAAVDEVFYAVVKGRNEMLGVIRDGFLTTG